MKFINKLSRVALMVLLVTIVVIIPTLIKSSIINNQKEWICNRVITKEENTKIKNRVHEYIVTDLEYSSVEDNNEIEYDKLKAMCSEELLSKYYLNNSYDKIRDTPKCTINISEIATEKSEDTIKVITHYSTRISDFDGLNYWSVLELDNNLTITKCTKYIEY